MKKRVLKRSMTGIETEFHLLDDKGKICNRALEVIKELQGDKDVFVTKEIGQNMIEFGSYPGVETYNPAINIVESLQKCVKVCEENGLWMYPFGTYPGSYQPLLTVGPRYKIQEKIFGKERIAHACRVTGFHHHYTLPKGVFDAEKKVLRMFRKSKLKRSMVSSYNFEIAADPALTLFAQSSPFYENQYIGKDSRVIVYRGGKKLKFMAGVYAKMQQMGGLPPYKQTATDLMTSLSKRWAKWRSVIKKADLSKEFDDLYPHRLDISWHPVKINKHGTLEQRGMDINFMSTIIGISVLLKFCLKKIQREFIEVLPADFGIDEAFKIENNILYIPPHTYVRNSLQRWSAYEGYDHKMVVKFAKRFFNFARSCTPKRYGSIIAPIEEMLDSKKSMSDRILQYAKYKGYLRDDKITDSDAAELSLYYSRQFPKDLEKTRKRLNKIAIM